MNLDFSTDDFRFNARASAIIVNKDTTKILVSVLEGRDFYVLPGGRIECFEDSKKSIVRELNEELGLKIDVKLGAIVEDFINWQGKRNMQYNFIYKGIYTGDVSTDEMISKDNSIEKFCWIDVKQLDNVKIFPTCIKDVLLSNELKHIITSSTGWYPNKKK